MMQIRSTICAATATFLPSFLLHTATLFLLVATLLVPSRTLAKSRSADTPPPTHSTGAADVMNDHMAIDPAGKELNPMIARAPEAGPTSGQPAIVRSSNRDLKIQINGIVCSFCAHGLEKALSKLSSLDVNRYGNGVLVDIETQIVTLAYLRGAEFPFSKIHRRIVKAGYDPINFEFFVTGRLSNDAKGWVLESQTPSARYALSADADNGGDFVAGEALELYVQLDAGQAETLAPGELIRVQIHAAN